MPNFERKDDKKVLKSAHLFDFLLGKVSPDNLCFFQFQNTDIEYLSNNVNPFLPIDPFCGKIFYVVFGVKFEDDLYFLEKCPIPLVFIACEFYNIITQSSLSVSFIGCSGRRFLSETAVENFRMIANRSSWGSISLVMLHKGSVLIDEADIDIVDIEQSSISDLIIRDTKMNDLRFRNNQDIDSVRLVSLNVANLEIGNNSNINSFRIGKFSLIKEFRVASSFLSFFSIEKRSELGTLVFEKVKITNAFFIETQVNKLQILAGSEVVAVFIKESTLVNYWAINDSKVGTVMFYESTICYSLSIMESVCNHLLTTANSYLVFLEVHESELGTFRLDNQQTNVRIAGSSISRCWIKDCSLNECRLELKKKADIFFEKSTVNHLDFENSSFPKDGLLSIVDCSFYYIAFSKTFVLGQLVLQNIKSTPFIEFVSISVSASFAENGSGNPFQAGAWRKEMLLSLQYINHNRDHFQFKTRERLHKKNCLVPQMDLVNSSLGKTEMTDCRFFEFKVVYRNSRILEIFIPGTKFDFRNMEIAGSTGVHDEMEQKASIHHQLKKVYENQGDFVQSSFHHSQAMRFQYRLLGYEYKNAKSVKVVSNWFERRGYSLNWISSAYGESWPRALVFILMATLFWYTWYYMSVHFRQPVSFSMDSIADYCKHAVYFFDITHKINIEATPGWAVLWDCLGRIFIGYGIFQFIAAFRRHGKKAS